MIRRTKQTRPTRQSRADFMVWLHAAADEYSVNGIRRIIIGDDLITYGVSTVPN